MVIAVTYACWVSLYFHIVYLLTVVFLTAYFAGTYYRYTADRAERAAAALAAERLSAPEPSAPPLPIATKVAPLGGADGQGTEPRHMAPGADDIPVLMSGSSTGAVVPMPVVPPDEVGTQLV